jgi:hypothetical protein
MFGKIVAFEKEEAREKYTHPVMYNIFVAVKKSLTLKRTKTLGLRGFSFT